MNTSLSLPERLYLLCLDLTRYRPSDGTALVRGQLLRTAAVAELCLTGYLDDRDGRPVRAGGVPADAFLAEVLDVVPADAAGRWYGVVDAHWWAAEARVRDGLAARGLVTVIRRRWLGVIPHHDVTPSDRTRVRELRDRIRGVVLADDPTASPLEDAVLAAIVIDGGVCTVLSTRERREHRVAVRALGDHVDTALPGLRRALVGAVAARRSATVV